MPNPSSELGGSFALLSQRTDQLEEENTLARNLDYVLMRINNLEDILAKWSPAMHQLTQSMNSLESKIASWEEPHRDAEVEGGHVGIRDEAVEDIETVEEQLVCPFL